MPTLETSLNPLRVYGKREACQLLGIAMSTFDRLPDPPPRIQISERRYGYRAGDLMQWLDARAQNDLRRSRPRRGLLERLQADGYKAFKVSKNRFGPYILPDAATASETTCKPEVPSKPETISKPFILRPRGIIDPASIPPRKWLGGGQFYQRRTVSTTIAPGDTGKTTLGMVEGVSMQTTRCLLGDQPEEKLRIWIHNGEEGPDELDRKLAAICQYYKIPLEEVADIFLTTATDFPLRVASGYSEIVPDKPLIKCIHEQIGDKAQPAGNPAKVATPPAARSASELFLARLLSATSVPSGVNTAKRP
jgi:hypothetical protein